MLVVSVQQNTNQKSHSHKNDFTKANDTGGNFLTLKLEHLYLQNSNNKSQLFSLIIISYETSVSLLGSVMLVSVTCLF